MLFRIEGVKAIFFWTWFHHSYETRWGRREKAETGDIYHYHGFFREWITNHGNLSAY